MKELYHVCMTAHNEVLIRNVDDVRNLTNLLALAAYRTQTDILVDSIMSNHIHLLVLSDAPKRFSLSIRYSVTKQFNHKYSRNNRLFDKKVFIKKIDGSKHIQMAINYCLRNGLHHGQSETAFAYPYSTCNYLFAQARGVENNSTSSNRAEIHSFLPKNAEFPDYFAIDSQGFISRYSFEEIRMAESWYGTPNNYIFNMNRRTTQEWINEQEKDDVKADVITLSYIEKGVHFNSESEMIKNEMGGKSSVNNLTDMEVCNIIDIDLLRRYRFASIYQLSDKQRIQIAEDLINGYYVKSNQAARCVAIPPSLLPEEYARQSLYKRH